MRRPAKWLLIGLLAAGGGIVVGFIPKSEQYSDWGFGTEGLVDLKCGSPFSSKTAPQFRDQAEGYLYFQDQRNGYDAAIFEGQTADQACESMLSGTRTAAIVAIVAGGVVALGAAIALGGSGGASWPQPAMNGSSLAPPPPPPPSPLPAPSPTPTGSARPRGDPTAMPSPPGPAPAWGLPSPAPRPNTDNGAGARPAGDAWWLPDERGR